MAKRGKGEGSIRKRSDGPGRSIRWEGRYTVDGRQRSVFGHTQEEVVRKLRAAIQASEQGLPVVPERQTVGQYLPDWLEGVRPTLRQTTYVRYENLVRLHAVPEIGRLRLKRVGPQHLRRLYAAKLATLAPRTVGHLHRMLHKAFGDAMADGLLVRNPIDLVRAPKVKPPDIRALTPQEARTLLEAARAEPLVGALYATALLTGMREGELLGLKWQDVDLEAGTLQVRRTLQRVRRHEVKDGEPKTEWVESEPKSARSRRSLALIPQAVTALRQHRRRQLEARLLAGPEWEDNDLVFPNSFGRPIERGNLLRYWHYPLLERAGLPRIRFHDLRHSTASLLLELGVHPKVVQEVLGHSGIGITMDTYSHVMQGLHREALERLGELLESESR